MSYGEQMKDLWKTLRLAAYIFALPLVATAAVSGHQLFQTDDAVSVVATPKAEASPLEHVGLTGTFRQHTIATDSQGDVSGRVWLVDPSNNLKSGLADTKVFFVKDGSIESQVYTDPDGTFTVSGLAAGAYSFIVSNVEGVAAYGVNVVEEGEAGEMDVVVVSKSADKAEQLVTEQAASSTASKTINSELVRGSNVAQLVDGDLEGQLTSSFDNIDFSSTSVEIFNGAGQSVGKTQADKDGSFIISDMKAGYYEFVASGPQGFAAFGFEALPADFTYTSTNYQIQEFQPGLSNPGDFFPFNDIVGQPNDDEFFYYVDNSPIEFVGGSVSRAGAFGGGGGGFGGGFGGGGFGGGGRLLSLAALGVGIAAIAEDDNNAPGPATPANN